MLNKGCLDIQLSLSGEEVLSDNRSLLPGIGSLSKVNSFINLDVLYKRVTSTVFRSSVPIVVFQNKQFNGLYAKEPCFGVTYPATLQQSQPKKEGQWKVQSGHWFSRSEIRLGKCLSFLD